MGRVRKRYAIPLGVLGTGVAGIGYASVIERNWFRLRRYDVPVLAPGQRPIKILHISDTHLTPGRRRLIKWVSALDALEPDLVVNTGDSISHRDAIGPFLDLLGPLLDRPGVFVYGSNDMYSPVPKNPARYLWRTSQKDYSKRRTVPDLPYRELGAAMTAAGWLDLNNATGTIKAGDTEIWLGGINDSHINRDRYDEIAGPAQGPLSIGVMHSPEPRNLDRFVADGYQLLLAGHTHGGQLCVPLYGALVTNCGIDRARVKGLSRHGDAWLHVSAGLGTSPYAPVRFCCPPEASLLTLVPAS
ncbi:metallophosphoesterase [Actinoallomurus rhizosphaericola]|uniref:metallophosphoesterase n=1 Tax=Actinoallomurus rhizosphaericola TaxID=2952536 RepID=UPI002092869F|nr:metallophosphoesterase [Actinoallomurus rhizosphaericola]MCO5994971.1 metallophosphoesterase [Actinoallomurus rhizosphaericola]